jgi:squalene-associated FAD-dependent desaturase
MKPPLVGHLAPHVAIVGGGLAGLAVAASLVDRGVRATLFEGRPRLGGRASSFQDPATGEMVDNCQHVSMACCTNLADFCRKVGIDHLFRRVPDVRFLSPEGKLSRLVAGKLPAPLHLAGSFLRANYLSWLERLRVAYGVACLTSTKDDRPGEPFEAWLGRHGQTPRTIERYWGTVLISALNERLDRMDVGHARKVFLDGFLRHRDGYQMEIPLAPLGEIYGSKLERWLADRGVEVRLKTGVRSVEVDDEGHLTGLQLRSGESVDADFVILASPFDRIAGLLPAPVLERIPTLSGLEGIEASPITGVHLWFDRPVCPYEHVVTVGRLVQWVFDHSAIQGRSTPGGRGQYLQVVISASYDLLKLDKAQILEAVLADLAAIWPASSEAKLERSWVVTEHGATFAVRPGIDALRPPQRTPVEGLFLAGDWTSTGWPATMEGAVRSGYLAAEGVLEDLSRPENLIRPDLPAGRLARWLLGPGVARTGGPSNFQGEPNLLDEWMGFPADEPSPLGH